MAKHIWHAPEPFNSVTLTSKIVKSDSLGWSLVSYYFPLYKGCLSLAASSTVLHYFKTLLPPTRNQHGLTKLADMAPQSPLLRFLRYLMAVIDNSRHRILPSYLERFDLRSRECLGLSGHHERFDLHGLR